MKKQPRNLQSQQINRNPQANNDQRMSNLIKEKKVRKKPPMKRTLNKICEPTYESVIFVHII